jgi:hypothetical protein
MILYLFRVLTILTLFFQGLDIFFPKLWARALYLRGSFGIENGSFSYQENFLNSPNETSTGGSFIGKNYQLLLAYVTNDNSLFWGAQYSKSEFILKFVPKSLGEARHLFLILGKKFFPVDSMNSFEIYGGFSPSARYSFYSSPEYTGQDPPPNLKGKSVKIGGNFIMEEHFNFGVESIIPFFSPYNEVSATSFIFYLGFTVYWELPNIISIYGKSPN